MRQTRIVVLLIGLTGAWMALPAVLLTFQTPLLRSSQSPGFQSPAVSVYHAIRGIVLVDQRPDGNSEPAAPCLGEAGDLVLASQTVAIRDEGSGLIGSGTLGSGIAAMSGNRGFVFALNGVPELPVDTILVGGINVPGPGITLDAMRSSAWDLGFGRRDLETAAAG